MTMSNETKQTRKLFRKQENVQKRKQRAVMSLWMISEFIFNRLL